MIEQLSANTMNDLINTDFKVGSETSPEISLKLVEVSKVKDQGDFECFSMIFHGPKQQHLEQSVYNFKQDSLKVVSMLLVPVGETEDAFQYQVSLSYAKK